MKGSLHNPSARSVLRWLPAVVLTAALLMSVFLSPVILQTAKAAPPVIKIGVAAALSGGVDWLGWRQANAGQLAVDQVNAAGGINVGGTDYNLEFVSENSSCDAAQAVTAANNLVASGVVAVVGHTCSVATIPAEPVYDAAGIAMISGSATSPLVTTQGYDIAFRTISKDTTLTDDLASRFYEKLGLNQVAMAEHSGYCCSPVVDAFEDTFVGFGGTITSRRMVSSPAEFNATLTAIKAENPDAIVYFDNDPGNGGVFSSIANGLTMSGVPVGWIPITSAASLTDYTAAAGAAAEGDYAAMSYRRTDDMPGYDGFNADHIAAGFPNFGTDADVWGAFAYDAAMIIIDAIQRADSTDPGDIRNAIASTANHLGVVGTYEGFDSYGDVIPQWNWLMHYQGGTWNQLSGTTFSDVLSNHWAYRFIESIWAAGLTAGFPDGTYRPDNRVTWAEMAVFLKKGIHGSTYSPPTPDGSHPFSDIDGHWAEAWIEDLFDEGFTSGFPDGTYRPDNQVTRAEIAVFLKKAIHGSAYTSPTPDGSHPFSDVAGHWAEAWIEDLYDEGITSGFPDGTYRPENQVTRAEMAVFLVNAFSLPLP